MGIQQIWAGQSAVNNPNQLPSISLWYNATTGSAAQFGSQLTDGSVVTTWQDLTGSGHDANKAGGSSVKPSWQANEQNGQGVVQFTSSETDSLDINPIAWAQSLSGATIYLIAKADTLAGTTSTIVTSNQNDFNISWDGASSCWQTRFAGGTGKATSMVGDTTNYHIFGVIFDGTQSGNSNRLKFRYDGQQQTLNFGATTVGTTTNASATYLYLGRDSAGTLYFNGSIGTIMIFTRALNTSECIQVETYLKGVWNVPEPTQVVTSGLQLYYDPQGSYPGTGTNIFNLAPTYLPGAMSNITYTSPYFTYNGTNSQVNIADNAILEPGSGNWTMEAWVYQTGQGGSQVILGKFDPGGLSADVSYSIRTSGSSMYAQMGDGTGAFINSTTYSLPLNTWKQVVYVWTNSGGTKTLETYINGVSIGTVNHTLNSILNTSSNLYLGSYNNGEYSQYYNGRIGVTRLYNTALTASGVLQNYNFDKSKYGL